MSTRSGRPRFAAIAIAIVVTLLGPAPAGPAPVRAGGAASTIVLGGPTLQPKPVGIAAIMTAVVTPPDATGTVTFYTDDNGARTELASAGVIGASAVLSLAVDMPAGAYTIVAVYGGDATYATSESSLVPLTVGPRTPAISLQLASASASTTVEQWDNLVATWEITDPGSANLLAGFAGSVEARIDGLLLQTLPTPNGRGTWTVDTGRAVGKHTLRLTFVPSNELYATVSAEAAFTLTANLVHATASVQYTTFYPVVDKYRDSVALKGSRSEIASVLVRVYSPSGKIVKSAGFRAAAGPWIVTWNGRTSRGAMLPAGRYKVVQKVTDAHGASRSFTNYVTLSPKRLYQSSATITKNVRQLTKTQAVWVAWSFTLPSATAYSKLVFSIYGKDDRASGGFGPHDFVFCGSAWSYTCAYPIASFPASTSWRSVTGVLSRNRSGRTVRLYAWGGSGNTKIALGRVRVWYSVLK